MKTYVTLLTADSYLAGVLVLWASLKKCNSQYPFLVLVSGNVSRRVIRRLEKLNIDCKVVPSLKNPHLRDENHAFYTVFDKLNIYRLTEYEKIVYIDADILVVDNIDELFDKPNGSAVNSGGLLPNFKHWTHLNSGVLVVEPDQSIFEDMVAQIGKLPSEDGGDQGFLQSYFYNWPHQKHLHLDQGYNMFSGFLNHFNDLFGYDFRQKKPERIIKAIHFWADFKPWVRGRDATQNLYGLEAEANLLWWQLHDEVLDYVIV
ncbi:MAG: glycosyltransferase family 8 protein [Spirosomataceae bacterium]